MSKKMRRQFKKIEESFKLIREVKETMPGADMSNMLTYNTRLRMNLADTIGRKKP